VAAKRSCDGLMVANEMIEPHQAISLYKNNSDSKGNSYGTHENYLVSRNVESITSCAPWCRTSSLARSSSVRQGGRRDRGRPRQRPLLPTQLAAEFFEEVVDSRRR